MSAADGGGDGVESVFDDVDIAVVGSEHDAGGVPIDDDPGD